MHRMVRGAVFLLVVKRSLFYLFMGQSYMKKVAVS